MRRSPLRKRSLKLAQAMRVYSPLAAAFIEEHPQCQSPLNCGRPSVCVHHRRGRFTVARLLDERYWAASCWPCNQWAEDDTGAALNSGWLLRIEGVA